jgi:predicted Fe-Mo cluster-binding NifX family protein
MSKLSDRIRKAGKAESAPFGFAAAARPAPAPSLITVVRLNNDAGKAGDAAKAGADAVIVTGDAGKLKDVSGDAVLGVAADKLDRRAASALREAGADFVVLSQADLAEPMLEEKLGFVLELRSDLDDVRLRLLGDLGLDAMILPAPAKPLTVERLVELRRVAALARTPLLVEDDGGAEASLLQLLRDSGVAGVVVPASAIGKLSGLRERIVALPARGKRREEHVEALVPAQATVGHDHDDDYDDD